MAKENLTAQPMFSLARTMLEEYEKQTERWLDYSIAQVNESAKIARTAREQAVQAARATLETLESFARSGS